MTAGFWCAFSDAAAAPTLCIKLQINLHLLQVYSKVQESFCTGIWDLWPCLSLTSVYVCLGGGPCLAGWWLSKNRYLSKHFAPQHAPAPPVLTHHPQHWVPPDPLARSELLVGLGFICYYLSDAAHLWAWLPLCMMGGGGSLVQSQWPPAVSHSSSENFSDCLCLTAALEERVREGKGGRNTIKMSCISTD